MLKNKIAYSALLIATFFISFNAHSEEARIENAEERQVMSLINKMTSSLQRGDIEKVMSTYEEGAIVMFEPGMALADREVSAQVFQEMAALKPEVTYSGHEVFIAGNIAMHISPWSMKGKTPDGQEVKQSGLSVAILRRQKDGDWKMIIDNPYASRLEN